MLNVRKKISLKIIRTLTFATEKFLNVNLIIDFNK